MAADYRHCGLDDSTPVLVFATPHRGLRRRIGRCDAYAAVTARAALPGGRDALVGQCAGRRYVEGDRARLRSVRSRSSRAVGDVVHLLRRWHVMMGQPPTAPHPARPCSLSECRSRPFTTSPLHHQEPRCTRKLPRVTIAGSRCWNCQPWTCRSAADCSMPWWCYRNPQRRRMSWTTQTWTASRAATRGPIPTHDGDDWAPRRCGRAVSLVGPATFRTTRRRGHGLGARRGYISRAPSCPASHDRPRPTARRTRRPLHHRA